MTEREYTNSLPADFAAYSDTEPRCENCGCSKTDAEVYSETHGVDWHLVVCCE